MTIYGTFAGKDGEENGRNMEVSNKYMYVAGVAGLALLATVLVVSQTMPVSLSNIDREDGTDALVNAVLVARAGEISTAQASQSLGIDPQLPFLGTSAYSGKNDARFARHATVKRAAQKTQKLWMPKHLALFQSLDDEPLFDPSTQFCADPDDCLRNDDYFKQNAVWHQAVHDNIMNPTGPAVPPNLPGVAWCDRKVNPSC